MPPPCIYLPSNNHSSIGIYITAAFSTLKAEAHPLPMLQPRNIYLMNSDLNKSPRNPATNSPARPENMPDFIIFGTAKSGTTAFHRALGRHPQIFTTTPKEPNFFKYPERLSPTNEDVGNDDIQTESAYQSLFHNVPKSQIRGEASVTYFHQNHPPKRIYESLPHVKLIVILRQPVDRAYSSWCHARHHFGEPIDNFLTACKAGSERNLTGGQESNYYLDTGYYARHLREWFAFFPRDQFKIFLYEDWQETPEEVLRETCDFLGISPSTSIPITRDNVTSIRRRFAWLHPFASPSRNLRALVHRIFPPVVRSCVTRFLRLINEGEKAPPLDASVRAELTARFETDMTELETLINRDLTHWRAPRTPPAQS